MKVTVILIVIGTGTGGLGNKRVSGNHPNYSIIEIGQNPEKSWRLEETSRHSNSNEKPSANVGVKNSKEYNNNDNNNTTTITKTTTTTILLLIIIIEINLLHNKPKILPYLCKYQLLRLQMRGLPYL